jgi:hypothetical protein
VSYDLWAKVRAKGTLNAASLATGVEVDDLDRVLAGELPTWPRLRRLLALYLDEDQADLFPDEADYDRAYEAGRGRRAETRLTPEAADLAASLFADARQTNHE